MEEKYRVIYKGVNGGYQLSEEMSFKDACEFRDKCLNMGYNKVHIVKLINYDK